MDAYSLKYDFGVNNLQVISDIIDDLNLGINTTIHIYLNAGGNAQLAVDLTNAITLSSAREINLKVTGYANSAAAFVVMGAMIYQKGNVNFIFDEPICLMYHRPRTINFETNLNYFDSTSSLCVAYDKLMFDWVKEYEVSYNNQQAYYSNHEMVLILQ